MRFVKINAKVPSGRRLAIQTTQNSALLYRNDVSDHNAINSIASSVTAMIIVVTSSRQDE